MASGNTLVIFTATDNRPPATAYATFDTRNTHPVLDFDAATDEEAVFSAVLPRHYGSGGTTITIYWAATSATTGDVVWTGAWERIADEGQDMDADSFATANSATATTAGTSGSLQYTTIAFTDGAQMDSVALGEAFRLKITRDANAVGDTMTGDAELWAVEIKET